MGKESWVHAKAKTLLKEELSRFVFVRECATCPGGKLWVIEFNSVHHDTEQIVEIDGHEYRLDVAVFDANRKIVAGIEVHYTNAVSTVKREKCSKALQAFIEVSAEAVIGMHARVGKTGYQHRIPIEILCDGQLGCPDCVKRACSFLHKEVMERKHPNINPEIIKTTLSKRELYEFKLNYARDLQIDDHIIAINSSETSSVGIIPAAVAAHRRSSLGNAVKNKRKRESIAPLELIQSSKQSAGPYKFHSRNDADDSLNIEATDTGNDGSDTGNGAYNIIDSVIAELSIGNAQIVPTQNIALTFSHAKSKDEFKINKKNENSNNANNPLKQDQDRKENQESDMTLRLARLPASELDKFLNGNSAQYEITGSHDLEKQIESCKNMMDRLGAYTDRITPMLCSAQPNELALMKQLLQRVSHHAVLLQTRWNALFPTTDVAWKQYAHFYLVVVDMDKIPKPPTVNSVKPNAVKCKRIEKRCRARKVSLQALYDGFLVFCYNQKSIATASPDKLKPHIDAWLKTNHIQLWKANNTNKELGRIKSKDTEKRLLGYAGLVFKTTVAEAKKKKKENKEKIANTRRKRLAMEQGLPCPAEIEYESEESDADDETCVSHLNL